MCASNVCCADFGHPSVPPGFDVENSEIVKKGHLKSPRTLCMTSEAERHEGVFEVEDHGGHQLRLRGELCDVYSMVHSPWEDVARWNAAGGINVVPL